MRTQRYVFFFFFNDLQRTSRTIKVSAPSVVQLLDGRDWKLRTHTLNEWRTASSTGLPFRLEHN